MIKITQDELSKNFVVSVALETIRVSFKIASQVARLLVKHGVTTVSVAKNEVAVEFVSYNDEMCADDVLWILVDGLGYWDYLGIYVESSFENNVSVTTNKDGSIVKLQHKNVHKLRDNQDFSFTFVGGLQYFQIFKDTVRINFLSSHISALKVCDELRDLLDSLS